MEYLFSHKRLRTTPDGQLEVAGIGENEWFSSEIHPSHFNYYVRWWLQHDDPPPERFVDIVQDENGHWMKSKSQLAAEEVYHPSTRWTPEWVLDENDQIVIALRQPKVFEHFFKTRAYGIHGAPQLSSFKRKLTLKELRKMKVWGRDERDRWFVLHCCTKQKILQSVAPAHYLFYLNQWMSGEAPCAPIVELEVVNGAQRKTLAQLYVDGVYDVDPFPFVLDFHRREIGKEHWPAHFKYYIHFYQYDIHGNKPQVHYEDKDENGYWTLEELRFRGLHSDDVTGQHVWVYDNNGQKIMRDDDREKYDHFVDVWRKFNETPQLFERGAHDPLNMTDFSDALPPFNPNTVLHENLTVPERIYLTLRQRGKIGGTNIHSWVLGCNDQKVFLLTTPTHYNYYVEWWTRNILAGNGDSCEEYIDVEVDENDREFRTLEQLIVDGVLRADGNTLDDSRLAVLDGSGRWVDQFDFPHRYKYFVHFHQYNVYFVDLPEEYVDIEIDHGAEMKSIEQLVWDGLVGIDKVKGPYIMKTKDSPKIFLKEASGKFHKALNAARRIDYQQETITQLPFGVEERFPIHVQETNMTESSMIELEKRDIVGGFEHNGTRWVRALNGRKIYQAQMPHHFTFWIWSRQHPYPFRPESFIDVELQSDGHWLKSLEQLELEYKYNVVNESTVDYQGNVVLKETRPQRYDFFLRFWQLDLRNDAVRISPQSDSMDGMFVRKRDEIALMDLGLIGKEDCMEWVADCNRRKIFRNVFPFHYVHLLQHWLTAEDITVFGPCFVPVELTNDNTKTERQLCYEGKIGTDAFGVPWVVADDHRLAFRWPSLERYQFYFNFWSLLLKEVMPWDVIPAFSQALEIDDNGVEVKSLDQLQFEGLLLYFSHDGDGSQREQLLWVKDCDGNEIDAIHNEDFAEYYLNFHRHNLSGKQRCVSFHPTLKPHQHESIQKYLSHIPFGKRLPKVSSLVRQVESTHRQPSAHIFHTHGKHVSFAARIPFAPIEPPRKKRPATAEELEEEKLLILSGLDIIGNMAGIELWVADFTPQRNQVFYANTPHLYNFYYSRWLGVALNNPVRPPPHWLEALNQRRLDNNDDYIFSDAKLEYDGVMGRGWCDLLAEPDDIDDWVLDFNRNKVSKFACPKHYAFYYNYRQHDVDNSETTPEPFVDYFDVNAEEKAKTYQQLQWERNGFFIHRNTVLLAEPDEMLAAQRSYWVKDFDGNKLPYNTTDNQEFLYYTSYWQYNSPENEAPRVPFKRSVDTTDDIVTDDSLKKREILGSDKFGAERREWVKDFDRRRIYKDFFPEHYAYYLAEWKKSPKEFIPFMQLEGDGTSEVMQKSLRQLQVEGVLSIPELNVNEEAWVKDFFGRRIAEWPYNKHFAFYLNYWRHDLDNDTERPDEYVDYVDDEDSAGHVLKSLEQLQLEGKVLMFHHLFSGNVTEQRYIKDTWVLDFDGNHVNYSENNLAEYNHYLHFWMTDIYDNAEKIPFRNVRPRLSSASFSGKQSAFIPHQPLDVLHSIRKRREEKAVRNNSLSFVFSMRSDRQMYKEGLRGVDDVQGQWVLNKYGQKIFKEKEELLFASYLAYWMNGEHQLKNDPSVFAVETKMDENHVLIKTDAQLERERKKSGEYDRLWVIGFQPGERFYLNYAPRHYYYYLNFWRHDLTGTEPRVPFVDIVEENGERVKSIQQLEYEDKAFHYLLPDPEEKLDVMLEDDVDDNFVMLQPWDNKLDWVRDFNNVKVYKERNPEAFEYYMNFWKHDLNGLAARVPFRTHPIDPFATPSVASTQLLNRMNHVSLNMLGSMGTYPNGTHWVLNENEQPILKEQFPEEYEKRVATLSLERRKSRPDHPLDDVSNNVGYLKTLSQLQAEGTYFEISDKRGKVTDRFVLDFDNRRISSNTQPEEYKAYLNYWRNHKF